MGYARILIYVALVLVSSGGNVVANTKVEKASCVFVNALIKSGAKGATYELSKMTHHWPSNEKERLFSLVSPTLSLFSFTDGRIYETANLNDETIEHLILMRTKERGILYIRILYEKFGKINKLSEISIQLKYSKIANIPFLQKPKLFKCEYEL